MNLPLSNNPRVKFWLFFLIGLVFVSFSLSFIYVKFISTKGSMGKPSHSDQSAFGPLSEEADAPDTISDDILVQYKNSHVKYGFDAFELFEDAGKLVLMDASGEKKDFIFLYDNSKLLCRDKSLEGQPISDQEYVELWNYWSGLQEERKIFAFVNYPQGSSVELFSEQLAEEDPRNLALIAIIYLDGCGI